MEIGGGLPAPEGMLAWAQKEVGGASQRAQAKASTSEVKPLATTLRPVSIAAVDSPFGADLQRAVESARADQSRADVSTQKFARGEPGRLHETMLDLEKAEISLKVLVGVRNKILDAYREVMHFAG